jgi:hypothetical protein
MRQLSLTFGDPTCACGRELLEHIEHYRRLCCMCVLAKTIAGHVWSEDPEPKRAHLQRWLEERAHG